MRGRSYYSDLFEEISCINCGSSKDYHRTIARTRVVSDGRFKNAPLNVVICHRCGLVFQNPQPKRLALRQFYESDYLAKSEPNEEYIYSLREQYKNFYSWLFEHLPRSSGMRILDIGSGYGAWLSLFDTKSNIILGIELSTKAFNFLRSKGLNVYQIDFLNNTFEDEEFDLITGLGIIEHLNDPLEALCEMNRILKNNDGYLYLVTPNFRQPRFRFGIESYFKLVHTFYFSPTTISSLLNKAGFEVVAIRERPSTPERAAEMDILARKIRSISYEEARLNNHLIDDPNSVISDLKRALRRDRYSILYMKFRNIAYRYRFLRLAILILRPIFRRMLFRNS